MSLDSHRSEFILNYRVADDTHAIPNRSERPTRHRGLIDSGQDPNSTAMKWLWAREPSIGVLDEPNNEDFSRFDKSPSFRQNQSGRNSFRGAGQHLLSSGGGPVHSDLLSPELRH